MLLWVGGLVDAFFDSKTSWKVIPQNEAWLYCDASSYYLAFVNACLSAESHIFIAGWDIHSETLLIPQLRKSLRRRRWLLKNFLPYLVKRRPHLNIYLLSWDYSPLYILERERFQSFKRGWLSHPGIHFQLDAAHPISASQHQKFVVIDDCMTFVGGLDITIRRWDDRSHRSMNRHRKDPYGEPYDPFHDYQIGVSGDVAREMSSLFRDRWFKATALSIPEFSARKSCRDNPAPRESVATFERAPIAVSRTLPAFKEGPRVNEIAELFARLIAGARNFVIMENQYLTSRLIVECVSASIAEPSGPEIIIILPEIAGGWLEKKTMGALQTLALQKMKEADAHGRLLLLHPHDAKRAQRKQHMTVHSKVLVADDQFLSVGSANLNNRSMGFDSECQLTIDGRSDPKLQASILETAAFIISHHTELSQNDFLDIYKREKSFIRAIEIAKDMSPRRHLAPIELPPPNPDVKMEDYNWLDMETPSPVEEAMDNWGQLSESISRRLGLSPRTVILFVTIAIALGIGALWRFTPLREHASQETIRLIFQSIDQHEPATMLIVPLVYALGSLLFIPINLLIIITASLFTTSWAFFYIFIGTIANVCAGYGLGILSGRYFFRQFFGRKTRKILHRIREGRFMTLVLLRVLPIAPSAMINLAAGAGQIPFLRFVAATLVGMAPGTFMLVVFQKSILDVFREQSVSSILTLLALGAVTAFLFYWAKRRFSQYQQR